MSRASAVLGAVLLAAACRQAPAPVRSDASPGSPPAAMPSVRYDQHVMAGGSAPAGDSLVNPYAGRQASAAEGEKLFSAMNCEGCHGYGATGFVGPSLTDGRWRYGGSDGAIFQSVFYGRPKGMPAFGGLLQPPIIWKIVTYLQSLPAPKAVPTQSW